ncbi:hypothetical protein GCM10022221_18140 [Actinocorallia aurea]
MVEAFSARTGPARPKVVEAHSSNDAVSVTYEGAAARLGVSSRTVRRMVADGRLKPVQVGRRRLIPVAALADLVEQGE